MRPIAFILAFLSGAGAAVSGCGSSGPELSCQTTTCSTGAGKTYQTCANLTGSVTYNFGGQSCLASPGNTSEVEACAADVQAYCEGATGTSSGGGGGSSGGGGSGTPCTFTVSGAQTGTGTCSIDAAYESSKGGLGFTITDGATFNFGITLTGQTTLTAGTYTLADVAAGAGSEYFTGAGAYDMCTTSQNCVTPSGASGGTPQGSFTLTITDPGPETAGVLWSSPAGTLVETLPAEPTGQVTGTVTVNLTL